MHSGGDSPEDLAVFLSAAQVGFPVLTDAGPVHTQYRMGGATTPFPLDYIIDPLGRVVYQATEYDPDAMIAVIDSLLADSTDVTPFPGAELTIRQTNLPGQSSALLQMNLPRAGAVWLTIHDLRGRIVREILGGDVMQEGDNVRIWDGRDDRNRGLASGIYLARLRQGPRSATAKIKLVR